jgi:hypothetical protein
VLKEGIDEEIFRLKNLLYSVTVSEAIKNKITDRGLKGFEFIPVEKYRF